MTNSAMSRLLEHVWSLWMDSFSRRLAKEYQLVAEYRQFNQIPAKTKDPTEEMNPPRKALY